MDRLWTGYGQAMGKPFAAEGQQVARWRAGREAAAEKEPDGKQTVALREAKERNIRAEWKRRQKRHLRLSPAICCELPRDFRNQPGAVSVQCSQFAVLAVFSARWCALCAVQLQARAPQ